MKIKFRIDEYANGTYRVRYRRPYMPFWGHVSNWGDREWLRSDSLFLDSIYSREKAEEVIRKCVDRIEDNRKFKEGRRLVRRQPVDLDAITSTEVG